MGNIAVGGNLTGVNLPVSILVSGGTIVNGQGPCALFAQQMINSVNNTNSLNTLLHSKMKIVVNLRVYNVTSTTLKADQHIIVEVMTTDNNGNIVVDANGNPVVTLYDAGNGTVSGVYGNIGDPTTGVVNPSKISKLQADGVLSSTYTSVVGIPK